MSEIENPAQPRRTRLAGDEGSNLVEYSMLVALIVVVCLSAVTFFGNAATDKVDCASDSIVALERQPSCDPP